MLSRKTELQNYDCVHLLEASVGQHELKLMRMKWLNVQLPAKYKRRHCPFSVTPASSRLTAPKPQGVVHDCWSAVHLRIKLVVAVAHAAAGPCAIHMRSVHRPHPIAVQPPARILQEERRKKVKSVRWSN